MAEKINWAMNADVVGGPKLSKSGILEVNAYDKFDITIPKGSTASPMTVSIEVPKEITFLYINSSEAKGLTCKIDIGKSIALDAPLLLVGKGATSLLGDKQEKFEFSNEADKDACIVMLIGRNAVSDDKTPPRAKSK